MILTVIRPLVIERWKTRMDEVRNKEEMFRKGYMAGYWDGVNDAAEVEAELEDMASK